MNKGIFVSAEGGDGAGKSGLLKRLKEYLENYYHGSDARFLFVNDPSSATEELVQLRHLLLSESFNFDKNTELLLYIASRCELVNKLIKPALAEGKIVFSDRFYHSTWVYQGYLRKHSRSKINYLNKCAGDVNPDFTILLDVDPKIGLGRSIGRLDSNSIDEGRWETMGLKVHNIINEAYRDIAESQRDKFYVVNTNTKDEDRVFEDVRDELISRSII